MVIIGLALFYFLYRKNHRHITRRVEELEENKVAGTVEPFPLPVASVPSTSPTSEPSHSQYGSMYNYPQTPMPTSPLTGLLSDHSDTIAPPSYEESSSPTAVPSVALQQARRPEKSSRVDRPTSEASSSPTTVAEGPSGVSPEPTPTRSGFTTAMPPLEEQ